MGLDTPNLSNYKSNILAIVRAVKVLVAFPKASLKSISATADPIVTKGLKSWRISITLVEDSRYNLIGTSKGGRRLGTYISLDYISYLIWTSSYAAVLVHN